MSSRHFVAGGLEEAEAKALTFWLNRKDREIHGLMACMFDSPQATKFIDDVARGVESWDQSCLSDRDTWACIRGYQATIAKDVRALSGCGVVVNRYRKSLKLSELRKVASRLQSDHDTCTDIIGDGARVDVLDSKDQAKEAVRHFAKSASYSGRLDAMNRYLRYFGDGTFYIMAGGSGTGKTNLALQAFEGRKVLYIGLDMTLPDVVKRQFEIKAYGSIAGSWTYGEMREAVAGSWEKAKHDWSAICERTMQDFRTIDVSSISVEQISFLIASEIEAGHKPSCVIVDYIDKLDSEKQFKAEHEKQKYIGRKLKEIAKAHRVGVLGLVQYNSSYEPYKTGQANWIQGSRDLIATSDGCICIWRSKTTNMQSNQEMSDLTHIWVSNSLKNRSTGYMDDMRIDAKGLWLHDHSQHEVNTW
jgi:hypothetical protein